MRSWTEQTEQLRAYYSHVSEGEAACDLQLAFAVSSSCKSLVLRVLIVIMVAYNVGPPR